MYTTAEPNSMLYLSEPTSPSRTQKPLDQTLLPSISTASPPMTEKSYPTFPASITTNDNRSQGGFRSKNGTQITNIQQNNYPFMFCVPVPNETTESDPNFDETSGSRFYKTRRCLFHQRGACIKGDQCTYAHTDDELKPTPDLVKTRLCQDWLNNICDSKTCKFAHGRHELRYTHDFYKTKICHFWHQGGCTKGSLCRHAHGQLEMRPQPVNPMGERESSNQIEGYTPSRDSTRSTSNSSPMWSSAEPSGSRQSGFNNLTSSHEGGCPKYDVFQALQLAEEAKRLAERSAALLARTHDNSLHQRIPNSLCDPKMPPRKQAEGQFPPIFSSDLGRLVSADNTTSFKSHINCDSAKQTDTHHSIANDRYSSVFRAANIHGPTNSEEKIPDIGNLLAALPSILTDNDLDLQSFIELLDSSSAKADEKH